MGAVSSQTCGFDPVAGDEYGTEPCRDQGGETGIDQTHRSLAASLSFAMPRRKFAHHREDRRCEGTAGPNHWACHFGSLGRSAPLQRVARTKRGLSLRAGSNPFPHIVFLNSTNQTATEVALTLGRWRYPARPKCRTATVRSSLAVGSCFPAVGSRGAGRLRSGWDRPHQSSR